MDRASGTEKAPGALVLYAWAGCRYDLEMAAPKGFRSWQDYFDRHIAECENCAPYFQGEGYMSIEGTHSIVEDLQCHIDVPERLTERLIENGHCAGCGAAVEDMAECWVRRNSEVLFDRRLEAAKKRYGPRLSEFRDYLSKHPFLGASHPTGRALIRAVQEVPPITVDGRWYRGLRCERGRVPKSGDFRAPDDSRSWIGEGRFNHSGQAHWYLADGAATCVAELLDLGAGVVDVQEVELAACADVLDVYCPDGAEPFRSGDHLTDLVLALILIDANLYARVERHRPWKSGYLLPRFVMDAAKAAGFAGIRYRSVRSFQGQNVVLFDRESPATFVGKPVRYKQDDLAKMFETSAGEDLF